MHSNQTRRLPFDSLWCKRLRRSTINLFKFMTQVGVVYEIKLANDSSARKSLGD